MKKPLPSLEELRHFFLYDYATGLITWRVRVNSYRGKVKPGVEAGIARPDGRIKIGLKGKEYFAHRIAWLMFYGTHPIHEVDHINGDPSDNRICNLREVVHSVNIENQRKARVDNKSCGMLGVSFNKRAGKFSAQIRANGKKRHLGLFLTAEEAHEVYVEAKRQLHLGCTI